MDEDKIIWIRCQDIQTERRVIEALREARDTDHFPNNIHALLSYGDEIKMKDVGEFISQLEGIVSELKEIHSYTEKVNKDETI